MAFRALLLATLLPTAVIAHDYKLGDLVIEHPHSYATPPVARAGAGYMTIRNTGTEAEVLLSASAGFADAQIHITEAGADGVMRMIEQEAGVPIPAGESVSFMPGGLHVMFTGLQAPFVTGEANDVTLVFERAGEITVSFEIEDRPAVTTGTMGHEGH
ncbi:copper chaperone PCu(A)C [Halovulum dunhuangense]|uniref:Copper chaperone PCu(A)C n=1 Tax=Halovulum dunhuangense TaxID=1505036 RepID=A0A849L0M6_9RHOB|nr:copper chaperone PCu(A)C [Halovulum dunhuangense]NNU79822.1 copper chaperone PCu(A)C [Halovulum dunhuangense]